MTARPTAEPASPSPDAVAASALMMVAGSAFFVLTAAFVKAASDEANPLQSALFRSAVALVILLVAMRATATPILSPRWRAAARARGCRIPGVERLSLGGGARRAGGRDGLAAARADLRDVAIGLVAAGAAPRAALRAGRTLPARRAMRHATQPWARLFWRDAGRGLCGALFGGVCVRANAYSYGAHGAHRVLVLRGGHGAHLAAGSNLLASALASSRGLAPGRGVSATAGQTLMTASYRRAQAHVASAFAYADRAPWFSHRSAVWGERPDALSGAGIAVIVVAGVTIALTARSSTEPTEATPPHAP